MSGNQDSFMDILVPYFTPKKLIQLGHVGDLQFFKAYLNQDNIQSNMKKDIPYLLISKHIFDQSTIFLIIKSIYVQYQFSHPAILPLMRLTMSSNSIDSYYIYPEHLKLSNYIGFSHENLISNSNILTPTQKSIISYGIAHILKYIHQQNYYFGEVNPMNVFLDSKYYPYLTNFYSIKKVNDTNLPKSDRLNKMYLKNDVYAYSILYAALIEPVTLDPIAINEKDFFEKLSKGKRPICNKATKSQKEILDMMWTWIPRDRLSFDQILNYFDSGDLIFPGTDEREFIEYKNYLNDHQKISSSIEMNDSFLNSLFIEEKKKVDDNSKEKANVSSSSKTDDDSGKNIKCRNLIENESLYGDDKQNDKFDTCNINSINLNLVKKDDDESQPNSIILNSKINNEYESKSQSTSISLKSEIDNENYNEYENKSQSTSISLKSEIDNENENKPQSTSISLKSENDNENENKPQSTSISLKSEIDNEYENKSQSTSFSLKSENDNENENKSQSTSFSLKSENDSEYENKPQSTSFSLKSENDNVYESKPQSTSTPVDEKLDDSSHSQIINLNEFYRQRKIGQGGFCKVYKITDKKTGEIYSAKILSKITDEDDKKKMNDFINEITIISVLHHPTILEFIGFSIKDFKNKLRPIIITKYYSNGSLFKQKQSLDDTQKLIYIYGIASALSYLHSNNIIHRDLKPDNILSDDELYPKISDFGLSIIIPTNKPGMSFNESVLCGTPAYIAPEVWANYDYSKSSDVYSFSLIIFQLIMNETPFPEGFTYIQLIINILNNKRPSFNHQIPSSYKKLIESCWSQNPEERPSFDDILSTLENDSGFITNNIDSVKYKNFIEYIRNSNVNVNEVDFGLKKQRFEKYIEKMKLLFKEEEEEKKKPPKIPSWISDTKGSAENILAPTGSGSIDIEIDDQFNDYDDNSILLKNKKKRGSFNLSNNIKFKKNNF